MAKFGIGQPMRRMEDGRFLTGAGRYVGDIDLPRQLHGLFLRSPHAHAKIKSIDVSAARAMPGVVLVATAADMKELGGISADAGLKNKDGTDSARPVRWPLAKDRVRHVGEAIALVAAETVEQAKDALEAIQIDFDPLPVVTDPVAALKPDAPQLHEEAPGNLCFDWELGEQAPTEAAFAKAAKVVRLELINNRVVVHSMEPRGAVGAYDAYDGRYTLHVSSQGSHWIQRWLVEDVLRLPRDRVRVITNDVGGGFGMKAVNYPEYGALLWAAKTAGRPIKWIAERGEAFLSDTHGRDHVSVAEMALDRDGHFLALRVKTIANMGGSLSNFAPYIPTFVGAPMNVGIYKIPTAHLSIRGAFTNTVPVEAYRGAGRPEAAYLIERLVDTCARETGLTPDEIRRRNMIPPEAMPYETALGESYDSGEFARLMNEGMKLADWAGFPARREQSKDKGKLRGIGMATYIESCAGGEEEIAELRIESDGGVAIVIGTQSNGQGHATAYAQLVAEQLGIDPRRVRLIQGDTDQMPYGGATAGSRSLNAGGHAIVNAANKVIAKGKRIAAVLLESAEADIEFAEGSFSVTGTDRALSFDEVAAAAYDSDVAEELGEFGFAERAHFKPPANTYPNGCHICELEVDPDTGIIDVLRYNVIDDFGKIVNPLLVEGQIHGGVAQGLGQALHEHVVYDPESGQLLSGSLVDYTLPRADHLPDIECKFIEVPCRTNPLGIKGAGEAGAIAAPAAVMNALVDALAARGVAHIDMPATPLAVWQALQTARKV
ncbi:xanthine dehydrogenase family protein molybdopterin-binding subunit [Dongia deserti]|uniref:xanthine dehydrogenase family protein molybdopterin-binding subunit n=1 Tax=Dongia deserti TaxID=2268030 RepID=UPI000E649D13|nr:xanthine dehydrogenase family protein molybdopterin-binding subunit [Dongia deserti]